MSCRCREWPMYCRTYDPPITIFEKKSALFAAFKRVDPIPILLHVHNSPTPRLGFSQSLVQVAERRPLISIFADGIGVVNEQSKARLRASGSPLQHRQIAVGVA